MQANKTYNETWRGQTIRHKQTRQKKKHDPAEKIPRGNQGTLV